MIEAMPQAMMGMGSSNGHGYSAGREFLSIQKVFNKTKSITLAARAGAEDFVGFKKEFADLSTILSFSYEVKDGRWMNNGRSLDEINDPDEIGGDRILRVLAAEKAMNHDSSITQAAVISEDLGFGRSYLYLFQRNADQPEQISALAIEYQGSGEALGNFVENLWTRSRTRKDEAKTIDYTKPIFFTEKTAVGVVDVFDMAIKSLQKEVGADNTRSYLSRFARDSVDFPSVLARQEIEIENLTRKYQEQMLQDTDVVSGIASMVAGSVAISAKWQETINERSKFSTVPPQDFQFRSSRRVSEEPLVPKSFLVTSATDTNFTAVIARTPTLRQGTRQSDEKFPRSLPAGGSPGMTEGAKLVSSPDPVFYVPAVLFFIRTSEISQEERPQEADGTSFLRRENPDVRLILLTEFLLIMTGLASEKGQQIDQPLPTYPEAVFTKSEDFDREDKDNPKPDKVGPFNNDRQFTNEGVKLNTVEIDDQILLQQSALTNLLDILDLEVTPLNETDKAIELLTLMIDDPHPESPKPTEDEKDSAKVQAVILRIVENLLNDPKGETSEIKKQIFLESLTRLTFWNKILTDEKTPFFVKRIVAALLYLEIREDRLSHAGSSDTDNLIQQLIKTYPEKVFSREICFLKQLTWQDLSRLVFVLLCFLDRLQKMEHIKPSLSNNGKYSWEKLLGLFKIKNMLNKTGRNKKMKRKKSTVIFQYASPSVNTRPT